MSFVSIGRFARPGMASVNTFWIETTHGLIVIDGQRELSAARAAKQQMTATGKPILAVFLTHPHPDHFGGIGVFAPKGAGVPVYGSAQTRESISADRWGLVKASHDVVGDDFPAEVTLPDAILADSDPVEIDGVVVLPGEMGGGEAECMTVLHLPQQRVLFAADIVQHRMTAFLLEKRTRAWIAQLRALRERFADVRLIYPGHGEPGPADVLISAQIEYLETFVDLAGSAPQEAEPSEQAMKVASGMNERYPGYQPVAAIPDLLNQDAVALLDELGRTNGR